VNNTYFKREEFACSCGCGRDVVDSELLEVLMRLREYYSQPITITSGNRCVIHNEAVGGSPESQHLLGKAVDIKVKDTSPTEVFRRLDLWYPNNYGLSGYSSWVHLDVRENKSRW